MIKTRLLHLPAEIEHVKKMLLTYQEDIETLKESIKRWEIEQLDDIANTVDDNGKPYIEWTITMNPERVHVGKVTIADLFNPDYLEFNTKSSWFEMRHVHSGGSITTEGYQYDIVAENSGYTIEPYQHDDDGRKGFKLELDPVGQTNINLSTAPTTPLKA